LPLLAEKRVFARSHLGSWGKAAADIGLS
jgi:hypothetical protein